MNLIGAIVVNLWVAGWMIAAVRVGLKARDVAAPQGRSIGDPTGN